MGSLESWTRALLPWQPSLTPEARDLEPGSSLPLTCWSTSGTTFTFCEPQLPHVRNGGVDSHVLKLSCTLNGLKFVNVHGTLSDLEEALRKLTC